MCRIGLTLTTTLQSGLSITSANGRYRLRGTSTWTTFTINLSNPKTPDINVIGLYELQVNISDSSGSVSPWSPNTPLIFEISENCLDNCNFDGTFYHYNMLTCDGARVIVKSNTVLITGTVYETNNSNIIGTISRDDCTKTGVAIVTNPTTCPTANICQEYLITNVSAPNGATFEYISCSADSFGGEVEIPFGEQRTVCGIIVVDGNNDGLTFQLIGSCGNI
jgi:hypothetical protein